MTPSDGRTLDDSTTHRPRLITTRSPRRPAGVAIVLHGGGGGGREPVRATQPSVLRLVPVAASVAHAGRGQLAVVRLINAFRGWRSGESPTADVDWALAQVAERYGPDLPISLVGHSLGGSIALRAAGAKQVRSVVALAPWLKGGEAVDQLAGRQVLILQGTADRISSPSAAQSFARAAAAVASTESYLQLEGGTHALLRSLRLVDGVAAQFVRGSLLGIERVAGHGRAAALATRALRGESPIVVD